MKVTAVLLIYGIATASWYVSQSVGTPWYDKVEGCTSVVPRQRFLFPVVWTTLYVLIALDLLRRASRKQPDSLLLLWCLWFLLSITWCRLFFAERRPSDSATVLSLALLLLVSFVLLFYGNVAYVIWVVLWCMYAFWMQIVIFRDCETLTSDTGNG